jgi:hypothetical protein
MTPAGVSGSRSPATQAEQRAVSTLSEDLSSGRWAERNRDLTALDTAEFGLRLLVA